MKKIAFLCLIAFSLSFATGCAVGLDESFGTQTQQLTSSKDDTKQAKKGKKGKKGKKKAKKGSKKAKKDTKKDGGEE